MNKSQTYTIGDRRITACAFFMSNMLHINESNKTLYQCSLDDYTNYAGNMETFVNEIVALKNKGLSQTKISWNIRKIQPHIAGNNEPYNENS